MSDERGLFNKYSVTLPDGRDAGTAFFVLRPKDPRAVVALASDPALVDELRGSYVVRKFERWEGVGGRSFDDPDPWPVYGDPLTDAVALPLGQKAPPDVGPGGDLSTEFSPVEDLRVARVLSAYAEGCRGDDPDLAREVMYLGRRATEANVVEWLTKVGVTAPPDFPLPRVVQWLFNELHWPMGER